MTLNQLTYFTTVARLENYHRAAEQLFISQPSLSRSITALEEELGVELFEKNGRRITLTKAGLLFLDYAEKILEDCEIAKNKMAKLGHGGGKIDIGYIFPLANKYMPQMVRHFLNKEENAKVSFSFSQETTPVLVNKVRKGELDIGFGGYMNQYDDLEFFPIINREMVIVTSESFQADSDKLPLSVLMEHPVIGYDVNSWLGNFTKKIYRKHNLHPNILCECPDEFSIVALVSEDFGIALVPFLPFMERRNINIYHIADLDVQYLTYMFWAKDRYQLPAVSRFIEYMKEQSSVQ